MKTPTATPTTPNPDRLTPNVVDIGLYFLRLGATGFGGPVALANHMRADLTEKRRWLTPQEYEEGLAIATACPGPLAYQLGIYCGFVLRGLPGAVVAAVAFGIAPFVIVVAAGYFYTRYVNAWEIRALFYGVGPVVVALIVKACWNLAQKVIRTDKLALTVATAACIVTVLVQKELTAIFLVAGVFGIFVFAQSVKKPAGSVTPPSTSITAPGVMPFFAVLAGTVPQQRPLTCSYSFLGRDCWYSAVASLSCRSSRPTSWINTIG